MFNGEITNCLGFVSSCPIEISEAMLPECTPTSWFMRPIKIVRVFIVKEVLLTWLFYRHEQIISSWGISFSILVHVADLCKRAPLIMEELTRTRCNLFVVVLLYIFHIIIWYMCATNFIGKMYKWIKEIEQWGETSFTQWKSIPALNIDVG